MIVTLIVTLRILVKIQYNQLCNTVTLKTSQNYIYVCVRAYMRIIFNIVFYKFSVTALQSTKTPENKGLFCNADQCYMPLHAVTKFMAAKS